MNMGQLLMVINFINASIPFKSCDIEDFMESIFVQNPGKTDHVNGKIFTQVIKLSINIKSKKRLKLQT